MGVWCVCGVGVRRGVARGIRSQVVGMATSRRVAFSAHAFPAHALRFRRAFPACARRASGAGDAVNGKYEKKTVTVNALRYQVVLVDTLDRLTCMKR